MALKTVTPAVAGSNLLNNLSDSFQVLNELNQKVIESNQEYIQTRIQAYNTHLHALFGLRNPLEAFELNRKYLESCAQDFQQLAVGRYELLTKLAKQFSEQSNLESFATEPWSKFPELFKFK